MAIFRRHPRSRDDTTAINGAVDTAEKGSAYGSLLATILSAVAVGISCISFYLSVLQGPALEVYVPPTIQYGRDAGGETELFAIPITIANDGARSGTVISMELEVQNLKTNNSKRYYSAFVGEHPRETAAPNRQFARWAFPAVQSSARRCASIPLAIPYRGSSTQKVSTFSGYSSIPRLHQALLSLIGQRAARSPRLLSFR